MKRWILRWLAVLAAVPVLASPVFAAELLIPVGEVVGLSLSEGTVTVAAFHETYGGPAREAGVQIGDEIVSIDDKPIDCAQDVRNALTRSGGQIEMVIRRQRQTHRLTLHPQITADGPKLGILLKEGVTGIGTVTWYDPDTGHFGTLGHGVHDRTGALLHMVSGQIYDAMVLSVKAGQAGAPGQLRGGIDGQTVLGTIRRNTAKGVFGKSDVPFSGKALPVAESSCIRTGSATILSTVEGNAVQEYSVEILKIYPKSRLAGRNLLIHVTDPALLEATGGIVQGMSGSPIIQNGKQQERRFRPQNRRS